MTFDTKRDAEAYLAAMRADLVRGTWLPSDSKTTLRTYATAWLAHRDLAPRTREDYTRLLERCIYPTFAQVPLRQITPSAVRTWYASLDPSRPTQRAHAYALLKAICKTAVDDDLIATNPCRVRAGGQVKRASRTEPASLTELATLVEALPQRYRLMALLAAWCGLRFGELIELRGHDIALTASSGVIRVRRGVVVVNGKHVVGPPKSEAGIRDVAIPPHLLPLVRTHLNQLQSPTMLLFPAAQNPHEHMRPATLYKVYYPAREAAGRPDLRFHDLRHTGAVLAAATGATLAELMARLGHSTPGAAMRYQHAARGRDAQIADALSKLVSATPPP